jgi:hypothetical protein
VNAPPFGVIAGVAAVGVACGACACGAPPSLLQPMPEETNTTSSEALTANLRDRKNFELPTAAINAMSSRERRTRAGKCDRAVESGSRCSCQIEVRSLPGAYGRERGSADGWILATSDAVSLISHTCGELAASSVIVTVAERIPEATREKITGITQLEFTATAVAQFDAPIEQSVALSPPKTTLVTCSAALRPFATVIFCGVLLAPCVIVPERVKGLAGVMVTTGAGGGAATDIPTMLAVSIAEPSGRCRTWQSPRHLRRQA